MPPATAAIQINLIWMAPLMVVKQSQAAHIGGYTLCCYRAANDAL